MYYRSRSFDPRTSSLEERTVTLAAMWRLALDVYADVNIQWQGHGAVQTRKWWIWWSVLNRERALEMSISNFVYAPLYSGSSNGWPCNGCFCCATTTRMCMSNKLPRARLWKPSLPILFLFLASRESWAEAEACELTCLLGGRRSQQSRDIYGLRQKTTPFRRWSGQELPSTSPLPDSKSESHTTDCWNIKTVVLGFSEPSLLCMGWKRGRRKNPLSITPYRGSYSILSIWCMNEKTCLIKTIVTTTQAGN